MTKEQILALTGRELDAMVAEEIMDLEVKHFRITHPPHKVGWDCEYITKRHPRDRHLDRTKPVPHYSTDISAAWEIGEKVSHLSVSRTIGSRCLSFARLEDQEMQIAYADTAPEAICKAALLAVMEANT